VILRPHDQPIHTIELPVWLHILLREPLDNLLIVLVFRAAQRLEHVDDAARVQHAVAPLRLGVLALCRVHGGYVWGAVEVEALCASGFGVFWGYGCGT
jgi:hypothetical protein